MLSYACDFLSIGLILRGEGQMHGDRNRVSPNRVSGDTLFLDTGRGIIWPVTPSRAASCGGVELRTSCCIVWRRAVSC